MSKLEGLEGIHVPGDAETLNEAFRMIRSCAIDQLLVMPGLPVSIAILLGPDDFEFGGADIEDKFVKTILKDEFRFRRRHLCESDCDCEDDYERFIRKLTVIRQSTLERPSFRWRVNMDCI